jgi:tripartite-type tricarboxylate transporter receptor subunit TctC
MDRRQALKSGLAGGLALAVPGIARAQDRPIVIYYPFAAGGSGDAMARLVAEKMRQSLGRTVVVDNKAGAGGQLGVMAVKNAPADGNALLLTPIAPMAVYQHVYKKLEYDPIADFVAVSQLALFDFSLAVNPALPVTNLKEFIAWVKANPDKANFASPGAGTLPHFFGVLLGRGIGVPLNHVPYKGSAPALADVVAGHMPVIVSTTSDVLEQHRGGKVRIIATSDAKRSPFLPDTPTLKESGFAITGTGWYGAFARAGTPPDVVAALSKAMQAAVQAEDVRTKLVGFGFEPTGTDSPTFSAIQKADAALWEPAVKASGFTPTQ